MSTAEWDRAVAHFRAYLPSNIHHWVVALELPAHERILRSLVDGFGSAEVLVLGEDSPSKVLDVGERFCDDPHVGFLEFVVRDGRPDHRGIDYRNALMCFARWPPSRVRICFDVWDVNFATLFSEASPDVWLRCLRLKQELLRTSTLSYRSAECAATSLTMTMSADQWVEYTGFEEYDYMLPTGEVACLPQSVDGVLDVDGWVIGTLPFGLKYGRIRPADLEITFAEGEIRQIRGRNAELCGDLSLAVDSIAGLRTVGEVGIGQSRAVMSAVVLHEAAHHWHERHVGLHLGLGAELPETSEVSNRQTGHHLDVVLAAGALRDDQKTLLSW